MKEFNIGLDISTSNVGVCFLDADTDEILFFESIKLTSTKLENVWQKANEVKLQLEIASKLNSLKDYKPFQ